MTAALAGCAGRFVVMPVVTEEDVFPCAIADDSADMLAACIPKSQVRIRLLDGVKEFPRSAG